MKRLILASTALALLAAPAFAADLPARTMAPAPAPFVAAPIFTWTGFYAGVNAGWVQNRTRVDRRGFAGVTDGAGANIDTVLNDAFPVRLGSTTRNGFIGGVQAGYNQQFGMFVGGIEADINWLGDRRSTTSTTRLVNVNVGTRSRMDWLGTARLRAGVTFDRVMVYGTGGLAFGAPNHRTTVTVAGTTTHTGSSDDMKAGWTLGGGAEFAFTDNVTMKAEYLYYDLGRTTVTANPVAPATGTLRTRFDNNGHIARVGLNYKF